MISKGMLDAAHDNARYNVDLLYPYVEQGAYIVGCEPSCLLTLRDEYPNLLNDQKARMVAEKALLLEEFLDMLNREGRLNLSFKDTPNSKTKKDAVPQPLPRQGACGHSAVAGSPAAGAGFRGGGE